MKEEQKCDCNICKLADKLREQLKSEDTEAVLFACLKIVSEKAQQLDAERSDLTLENIVITAIDRLAGAAGFIREIGFVNPDDASDPKKGLH